VVVDRLSSLENRAAIRFNQDYLVDVAPAPVFAGFERLDDRVMRPVEVLGCVLVL